MGRRIDSDEVMTGRNRDKVSGDSKFMRCSRCRFIVDTTKAFKMPEGSRVGWGLKYEDDSDITDPNVKDPLAIGGCPQCGTYLYNKET